LKTWQPAFQNYNKNILNAIQGFKFTPYFFARKVESLSLFPRPAATKSQPAKAAGVVVLNFGGAGLGLAK
jgi:hypothetical protein